jgi:hypothetical protein
MYQLTGLFSPGIDPTHSVQLKRMGARSVGRSAACNDFIPTACVRNMMTWGRDLARYNLDMGREIAANGRVARIWEEDNSVLSTD